MTCSHFTVENYTNSVQGKLIYKDQCTKCFFDSKSEEGVDVCLKCFNGSCCTYKHSENHFGLFNHPLALNIKMRLQKEDEIKQKKEIKIDKLAVGIQGGADFDKIKNYESFYELKCLACNKKLDSSPVQGLVDSILKANSAFQKQQLVSWELEIHPCEHTLLLQQVPAFQIPHNQLAHCTQCELSTNLWLCLTCGNLACGRKNFDGSGGNNHAVEHQKATGHPLVVKMGTITLEGEASIYCYHCDNDVKDENLQLHLENFGIQVSKLEKTEQTVMELNLDLNLNFQLSKCMEEGKILEPVFGPGFIGLENIGNSCYINSVVQVLFSMKELTEPYYKEGCNHQASCKKFPTECFTCQLCKVTYGLLNGKFSEKKSEKVYSNGVDTGAVQYYQDGLNLQQFKDFIGKGNQEFSSNRQQDAEEYLLHLLSKLQKNEGNLHNYKRFEFKQVTKLQCTKCKKYKLIENSATELKLSCPYVKQEKDEDEYPVSFDDLLKATGQGEVVELYCQNCQKNMSFLKKQSFKTFPQYLIVQIQRFVLDNWVPKKIQAYIQTNEKQDFTNQIFEEPSPYEQKFADENAGPAVNEENLEQLIQMGFSKNKCIRALLANNNDFNFALNWIFENEGNPTLDLPIEENPVKETIIQPDQLEFFLSSGFNKEQAEYALSKTNNNLERAVDYLFNHPNELQDMQKQPKMDIENKQEFESETNSTYYLHGAIVHLGKSVHCGHYVAYVKKEGKWVYYNDNKVAISNDPLLGKAYLLIWKRVD